MQIKAAGVYWYTVMRVVINIDHNAIGGEEDALSINPVATQSFAYMYAVFSIG